MEGASRRGFRNRVLVLGSVTLLVSACASLAGIDSPDDAAVARNDGGSKKGADGAGDTVDTDLQRNDAGATTPPPGTPPATPPPPPNPPPPEPPPPDPCAGKQQNGGPCNSHLECCSSRCADNNECVDDCKSGNFELGCFPGGGQCCLGTQCDTIGKGGHVPNTCHPP